jgi:putative spermidine/putrescine transport system substrate-binding protein
MTNRMGPSISRRSALKGAAAVAGLALGGTPVLAQNKRVVLATWGGDYAQLLTKNISTPLMTPKSWEVVLDEAGSPQRRTKVFAEQRLPRGTSDVQALAATDIGDMIEAGVLEKLDLSKIPNSKNLLKIFSIADSPYFSPHI